MEAMKMSTINTQKPINKSEIEEPKKTESTQSEAELINDAKTVQENQQETKADTSKGESTGKVIVRYVGNGIWNDSTSKKWSNKNVNGTSIKNERIFSKEEYESRSDIKFMVEYGEMTIINV